MSVANNRDLLEFEELFRQVLRKLSIEWNRQVDQEVSGTKGIILEKLEAEGPQKASSLAEALSLSGGAITGLSDKLISCGFARRRRTEDDRRVVYLEITPKGREALKQVRQQRKKIYDSFFDGLSVEDLQHLIRIYRKILQNIHAGPKE